jgi:multiple antibiotic resistance protein
LTGGIIIAATAWSLLFENDANASGRKKHEEIGASGSEDDGDLAGKIFYPFTFPITAGPGTLVVMLTLSARLSNESLPETVSGHAGIVLAAVLLSVSVYLCYGYAPRLIRAVSPSTIHGILRVIAFILMCIGVQIAWDGISMLGTGLTNHK